MRKVQKHWAHRTA